MAQVLFVTEFSTYTNPVRLYYYLQSNPSAVVGTSNLPFPNIDGQETVVINLPTGFYRFEFWEIVAGVQTNLIGVPIYHKVKGDVSFEPFYYIVDAGGSNNPVSETDIMNDARLKDKPFVLFQQGVGHRKPATEYSIVTNGGWQLLNGEQFESGAQWMALVTQADGGGSTVITEYNGVNLVSESDDFGADYKAKHNVAQSAMNLKTSFPDFDLIADCKAKFSTYGMEAKYWKLQLSAGNTMSFGGEDINSLTLRKNEMAELLFVGGLCYVVDYKGDLDKVGQPVFASEKLINTEFADGHEDTISEYEDLIDKLPLEMVVSYDDWNLYTDVKVGENTKRYYYNRGKFAVNTLADTFKFPDWRGQTLRSLNLITGSDDTMLSQGAGGMWAQELIRHGHNVVTTGAQGSVNPGRALQRSATDGSGGEGDDPGVGSNKYIRFTGGTQQRIDSTGFYALVRI